VSGTASDNKALSKVEVKVGNRSWILASGNTSWTVSSMNLSAGSNIITAKATDNSNNTYETSVNVTYSLPDITHKYTSSDGGGGGTFSPFAITVKKIGAKPTANLPDLEIPQQSGVTVQVHNETLQQATEKAIITQIASSGISTLSTILIVLIINIILVAMYFLWMKK
jgi:hypothetical protein